MGSSGHAVPPAGVRPFSAPGGSFPERIYMKPVGTFKVAGRLRGAFLLRKAGLMNRTRLLRVLNSPLVGLVLGAAFFFAVFGPRILDPTYIGWQLNGDAGQHYLGWAFFRYEPWQFPLGKIVGFGTPDGSSIFYSDSIPLFAFFFKAIRGILPEPFQYTGLWILTCYLLQGLYGWRLCALATAQPYARALMTCLFVLAPCLLYRSDGHHALMAHWLLLAAVGLSVQADNSFDMRHRRFTWLMRWIALLSLSAVIHLYLTVMLLVLYVGALTASVWRGSMRGSKLLLAFGLPTLLIPSLLYLEGAFVVKSSDWTTYIEYGYFSMNLLSPIVPGYWGTPDEANYISYFLEPRKFATGGHYEGFNYLGLGSLLLVAFAILSAFRRAAKRGVRGFPAFMRELRPNVGWFILASALMITLLATSHKITLGGETVVTLPIGKRLLDFLSIFRSSGRFFWLPAYLVLWMACRSYGRQMPVRAGLFTAILQAIVAVQVIDLSQFFKHFAHSSRAVDHYSSPLQSAFWERHVREYREVLYYPPSDTSHYIPFGLLAAPLGTGINIAYKARTNSRVLNQATRQLSTELHSGQLRERALYVFKDKELFEKVKQKLTGGQFLLREVDGFYVAARSAQVR